ncbi:MAG: dTMP kinase [Bacteroidetes bacterium]|jgi:dTMP kinase|nr:dTMP kinase [Bacteroidota bacterium]
MSLFLTFEGLDFSGKSTQVRRLADRLRLARREVLVLREPGGTPVGEAIRTILLDRSNASLTPSAELFLFSASRAQLVEQVIRPALAAGTVVVCDRFVDSTTAYQGGGHGIDAEVIAAVNRSATGGLEPHMTFFLDLPDDERHRRQVAASVERDRMESNSTEFYARVRRAFLELAEHESRFKRLDGLRSETDLADEIWNTIEPELQRHGARI